MQIIREEPEICIRSINECIESLLMGWSQIECISLNLVIDIIPLRASSFTGIYLKINCIGNLVSDSDFRIIIHYPISYYIFFFYKIWIDYFIIAEETIKFFLLYGIPTAFLFIWIQLGYLIQLIFFIWISQKEPKINWINPIWFQFNIFDYVKSIVLLWIDVISNWGFLLYTIHIKLKEVIAAKHCSCIIVIT